MIIMLFNNLNYSHFWYISTMTSYRTIVRGNEQDPTNPRDKIIGKFVVRAIWHRLFHRLVQRMPFRCRTERTEGPLLSCKTTIRISNRDTIAIRAPAAWGEKASPRKHHRAKQGFEKSYRVESMFPSAMRTVSMRRQSILLFFFYSLTHGNSCDI